MRTKPKSKPKPSAWAFALIDQVRRAMPPKGCERDVLTFISRPYWNLWCEFIGVPAGSTPTEWSADESCVRVFGSKVIVFESDAFVSFSRGR